MSMFRDSIPENSAAGRGLRSIQTSLSSLSFRLRKSPSAQPAITGKRGHLGPRRAVRLSALLAPRNRLRFVSAASAVIIAGAVVGSLAMRRPVAEPLNNAIWLDRTWIYGDLESGRLRAFADRLIENQIGTAYAYVSSLGIDNRWSAGLQGEGSFTNSQPAVAEFVRAFKSQSDELRVYGWIEIWTHLDNGDGYRLDDANLHSNIADFSRHLVTQLGFDGVLLDVKPLFSDNDDLIRLIGRVRSAVGADLPIAVAVTADLTPQELRMQNVESIAPGTMWSPSFKKRVTVAANEVILLMYQSYRQEPLDYVNWVAYHVETYIDEVEPGTKILVSIPNYGGASSAHDPAIETIENALNGVSKGLRRLEEEKRPLLTGIAIFSDEQLSQSDWDSFRESWLQR